jgi:hypothetical protein
MIDKFTKIRTVYRNVALFEFPATKYAVDIIVNNVTELDMMCDMESRELIMRILNEFAKTNKLTSLKIRYVEKDMIPIIDRLTKLRHLSICSGKIPKNIERLVSLKQERTSDIINVGPKCKSMKHLSICGGAFVHKDICPQIEILSVKGAHKIKNYDDPDYISVTDLREFPNLLSLEIAFGVCQTIPPLSRLRHLELNDIQNEEEHVIPSSLTELRTIHLHECYRLCGGIPDTLTKLERITVNDCPHLFRGLSMPPRLDNIEKISMINMRREYYIPYYPTLRKYRYKLMGFSETTKIWKRHQ